MNNFRKEDCWGPFYWRGLTSIPTWISNHMLRKLWDEITYPFPNFNGFSVISFHTLQCMWLLIHAGIKVNPCYPNWPRADGIANHKCPVTPANSAQLLYGNLSPLISIQAASSLVTPSLPGYDNQAADTKRDIRRCQMYPDRLAPRSAEILLVKAPFGFSYRNFQPFASPYNHTQISV